MQYISCSTELHVGECRRCGVSMSENILHEDANTGCCNLASSALESQWNVSPYDTLCHIVCCSSLN